jgi:hypothetical protein
VPTHPIYLPEPPLGIWPSPGHPAHPIAPGGPPPGIWPSPGVPTHPIVLPPEGGGGPMPPGGSVTHPIVGPVGMYVVAWFPSTGYILVPVGGSPPPVTPPTPPVAPAEPNS